MIGDPTKMHSDSSYSDLVQHWFAQINRGIDKRKTQEKRWAANEAFEDMAQWMGSGEILEEGSYDQPTVNKIGSYIRTYRAAIAFRNPGVKMRPKNAAGWSMMTVPVIGQDGKPVLDEQGVPQTTQMTRAKARETLINDIITKPEFGLRDTISRIVKSACMGYGAAMVGYAPMFETPLEKDTDDAVPLLEDGTLDFEAVFIMNPLTGMPIEDDNGNPIKKNRIPSWEEWFIDWVHYRHLIIDPDGGNDFMKHRWICMEQIRTLEEVKADPLFKNTKDLQQTGTLLDDKRADRVPRTYDLQETDSTRLVRLFHVYDFVKDRRVIFADGHGETLLDEEMPLGITRDPFAFLRPVERIGEEEEFYPRPICTDLVPLVSENNEARRMLAIARKRGIRKIIIDKGALTPEDMEKLTNDEDLEVVESDKVSQYGGPDKLMHMLAPPPIGGDLYNNLNVISADFDEIGGMGSASRGKSTGDTATETNKLSQYEGTRYDFDRQLLKDMLIRLFKKLDDSIDANMTVGRAITISGSAGQMHQVLLDRDMIACDCDIDIDLAEMTPTDDAAQSSRMIQFAQVMGQNRWMATNEAVVRTMAERVGITDENFIKGFIEAAQQEAQREQQMLQMQLQASMDQAKMSAQAKGAGPGKDGKRPEGAPPENAGQEAMQSGAGMQVPRMQGGR